MILKIFLLLLLIYLLQVLAVYSRLYHQSSSHKLVKALASFAFVFFMYPLLFLVCWKNPTKIPRLIFGVFIQFPMITLIIREIVYETLARSRAENELGIEFESQFKNVDIKNFGNDVADVILHKV